MPVHHDYYVYVLFRETGIPFYIGMGRRKRWSQHEGEARAARPWRKRINLHKLAIVRSVLSSRSDLPKVKIAENLTLEQAVQYETIWIAALGREPNGPLVNRTAGGAGVFNPSAEVRAKRSARQRGFKMSPEHRAKLTASVLGKPQSPEHRMKIGAAHRGKTVSAETRAKLSASRLNLSEETLQKLRVPKSPAHRAKLSIAAKKRAQSPEGRANLVKAAQAGNRKRIEREQLMQQGSAANYDPVKER